jgi:hypothetical protein
VPSRRASQAARFSEIEYRDTGWIALFRLLEEPDLNNVDFSKESGDTLPSRRTRPPTGYHSCRVGQSPFPKLLGILERGSQDINTKEMSWDGFFREAVRQGHLHQRDMAIYQAMLDPAANATSVHQAMCQSITKNVGFDPDAPIQKVPDKTPIRSSCPANDGSSMSRPQAPGFVAGGAWRLEGRRSTGHDDRRVTFGVASPCWWSVRCTRVGTSRVLSIAFAIWLFNSCKSPEQSPRPQASFQDAGAPATAQPDGAKSTVGTGQREIEKRKQEEKRLARERCEARITSIVAEPASAGTPEIDRVRQQLFAGVKAEPLLFTHRPEHAPADDRIIETYRRWLEHSKYPMSVLGQLMPYVLGNKAGGRSLLLRDGYLYAEQPKLAETLVKVLKAEHLFREDQIWIQRGERVLDARRDGKIYRYVDGPQQGEAVSLILFDRVGVGDVPPAIHRDLRSLRYRLHFDRLTVVHLTERRLVADLFYQEHRVRTLLRADGARLEPECEVLDPEQERDVLQARRASELRDRAFAVVQRTIADQIDDRLPFDEPRSERGQEDGELRPLWQWAYAAGRKTYRHRLDDYPVFGFSGQPQVPEVCVDFLLDTLERAAGTWWRPAGQARERLVGRIDFSTFDRTLLRRVPEFVRFARGHPEWFDVLDIPETEQHGMRTDAFLQYLKDHTSEFMPGDIVLIAGRAPWDPTNTIHYHSFFIFDSDPLTGMPLLVAGNPGTPRLVTWNWERRRTPKRTIRHRVRPRPEWLASIMQPEPHGELEPPPLSDGPP